jgi:hypothetical protein
MAGFLARGIMQGVALGAGLADRKEDKQLRREMYDRQVQREDRHDAWAAEDRDWQRENRELQSTLQQYQLQDLMDDRYRKEFTAQADYLLGMQEMVLKDPEGFQAYLQQNPQEMRNINTAWNTLSQPWINQGGEPGTQKSFAAFYPTQDGKLAPMLRVTPPGGSPYIAPLTMNRSSDDDDEVMSFTPEELTSRLAEMRHLATLVDNHKMRLGDTSVAERRRAAATKQDERGTGPGGVKLSPYNLQTGDSQIADLAGRYYGGRYENGQWVFDNQNQAGRATTATRIAQELHRNLYQQMGTTPGTYFDVARKYADQIPTPQEALAAAKQAADKKAGTFRRDETDFGGSRQQWIEAEAQRLIDEATQQAYQAAQQEVTRSAEPAPAGPGFQRRGGGGAPAPAGGSRSQEGAPQGEHREQEAAYAGTAPRQTAGEVSPDLVERAKTDPEAYREVLQMRNPNASPDAIDAQVRKHFPNR